MANRRHPRRPTPPQINTCRHPGEVAVWLEASPSEGNATYEAGRTYEVLGAGADPNEALTDAEAHVWAELGDDATTYDYRPAT